MTGESNELLKKFKNLDQKKEGSNIDAKRTIFSRHPKLKTKQYEDLKNFFNKYDSQKEGYLGQHDIQRIFEETGNPLTYIELKNMMNQADKNSDNKIDLVEFVDMILTVTSEGETSTIDNLSPWMKLAQLSEIDISVEGVSGAANFFEAKSKVLQNDQEIENEIKREREQRKIELEEKKRKKQEFKNLRANFQ